MVSNNSFIMIDNVIIKNLRIISLPSNSKTCLIKLSRKIVSILSKGDFKMIQRHVVEIGLTILFLMCALITLLMWWAGQYSLTVSTAMMVLILLGAFTGTLIPSILTTWLIIGLTTIGSAILLLGYVVMTTPLKLGLLFAFPACASLSALSRYILSGWGWIDRNRSDINNYAAHYDQITKLQTKYNAEKLYKKSRYFVITDQHDDQWLNMTAIHWSHNQQLQQFHRHEYNMTLRTIAKVLKQYRLPSESLYYLDHGTFLIVSFNLAKDTYDYRNQLTEQGLDQIRVGNTKQQFKWGTKLITAENAATYSELSEVMRHIERDMETDLIVEYLKEDSVNG